MKLSDFMRPLGLAERHALAFAAGTTYLHLRNVAFSGKRCGAELAVAIEAATGRAVMRWDLRPNDWHRIWPELLDAEGRPPVPETPTNELEARDAA